MTARSNIVDSLVTLLNGIDGTGTYSCNMFNNATKRLVFWDEVVDFPHISVVAGSEQREYLPGGFKWGNLSIDLKIYVQDEDPIQALELLMQDIERLIDANNEIDYGGNNTTQELRITSIETDEGLLAPYGVGEISLQVLYEVQN